MRRRGVEDQGPRPAVPNGRTRQNEHSQIFAGIHRDLASVLQTQEQKCDGDSGRQTSVNGPKDLLANVIEITIARVGEPGLAKGNEKSTAKTRAGN